jgi:methylenetetrahydrofolate dehydrogenase (NADP+)/methenyltetrahydrofolate cyclohydrolase
MSARILDGRAISAQIKNEIRAEIQKLTFAPRLAVVLCSDDPASAIYVRKKQEACREVGIDTVLHRPLFEKLMSWDNPQHYLERYLYSLNEQPSINGILLQLPLPKMFNQYDLFDQINPLKDVDVFNPINVGLLSQGRPRFVPCTPAAIQELLLRSGVTIAGKKVCIINRSCVVGKPLHALLVQDNDRANATVTLCHDQTPPDLLKNVCLASDIIVVAVGKLNFLTADMVRAGQVVVDVGINRLEGNRIVGDVDFGPVSGKVEWISPVPGGVGPLTVTMLLRNTLLAANLQNSASTV